MDEKGKINLGGWIRGQRRNTLPESEQGQLLSKIGMSFEKRHIIIPWEEMYKYAKIYYDHYHNLEVPIGFITNDGYTMDENGLVNLGRWISRQRSTTSPKSVQGQLLIKIGMSFDNQYDVKWNEMYEYAKIYYEHHHNLRIPTKFKTTNGYEYDEDGNINLWNWLNKQRGNFENLSEKRKQLLLQIGMVFDIKKNKKEINNICEQYNIDKNKNKTILNHISMQELQSKIRFLKAHNIPIVDNNGLLIDIFSMSSPDMKAKYGISLEEIISEYYIKNQMGKGV